MVKNELLALNATVSTVLMQPGCPGYWAWLSGHQVTGHIWTLIGYGIAAFRHCFGTTNSYFRCTLLATQHLQN